MKTTPGRAVLAAALAVSLGTPARADRVELLTGEVFEGDVLRCDEHEVSVRLRIGGAISFRRAQVRRVRRSAASEDEVLALPAEEAPTRSGPQPAAAAAPAPAPAPVLRSAAPAGRTLPARAPGGPRVRPLPRPTLAVGLGPLSDAPIVDAVIGFQLAPPSGFLPWPAARVAPVLHAYRDPVTEASLTIASFPLTEPIEAIRRRSARTWATQVEGARVVRDEAIADSSRPAWVLEVVTAPGGVEVHQTQVFTGNDERVVLLTYTTTAPFQSRYREAFTASIASLEFLAPAGAPSGSQEPEAPLAAGTPGDPPPAPAAAAAER
jgi:hypothetical protein